MKALKIGFKLTSLKTKKRAIFVCSLCSLNHCFGHLAGKKVHISNDFAKDLGEIMNFLDRFRPEIDAIGKEPENSPE